MQKRTLKAMKMEGVFMLLVLLLHVGSITAEAQPSYNSLSATVLEGEEQVCPAEEQLETARAIINQSVRGNLEQYLAIYIDCRDAYEQGQTQSGVYTIQPDSEPAFQAYCDMDTDGGGWTVFQRRQDGFLDFNLYWTDYEHGFGNFSNEFWLGLAQIHRLTNSTARTELRVDLEDFSSVTGYAQYTNFGIGDASSNYVLTATGYNGTVTDSLIYHYNFPFSTRDRDNTQGNCPQLSTGAWWYYTCYRCNICYRSNLNGIYFPTPVVDQRGMVWYYFSNRYESLKFSEMKLRRA